MVKLKAFQESKHLEDSQKESQSCINKMAEYSCKILRESYKVR